MSVGADFAYLDEKIRSLAAAYTTEGRPYLLSKLGKDLGVDLHTLKTQYSGSLASYVKERLASEFTVVLMGQHGNVQAVVPAGANAPTSSAPPADHEAVAPVPSGERKNPRFNYRFWAAFAVPLLADKRRWLNMDDLTFKDELEEPSIGTFREIPAALIPDATAENRDEQIRSNITSWLTAEQLSVDAFIATVPTSRSVSADKPSKSESSVLEALIGALDKRQLAATTLTLDVVAALLRRHV